MPGRLDGVVEHGEALGSAIWEEVGVCGRLQTELVRGAVKDDAARLGEADVRENGQEEDARLELVDLQMHPTKVRQGDRGQIAYRLPDVRVRVGQVDGELFEALARG